MTQLEVCSFGRLLALELNSDLYTSRLSAISKTLSLFGSGTSCDWLSLLAPAGTGLEATAPFVIPAALPDLLLAAFPEELLEED